MVLSLFLKPSLRMVKKMRSLAVDIFLKRPKRFLPARLSHCSVLRCIKTCPLRKVQYCQGMNYICSLFLLYMPEENAFWMLVASMNRPRAPLRELFLPGMMKVRHVLEWADTANCYALFWSSSLRFRTCVPYILAKILSCELLLGFTVCGRLFCHSRVVCGPVGTDDIREKNKKQFDPSSGFVVWSRERCVYHFRAGRPPKNGVNLYANLR